MATSRLERVGTIYSRISGLLRSGALKPDNKPIWYDVYQQFPPKFAPRVDRPVPTTPVTPIFYPEDLVRSNLAKGKSTILGTVTLQDKSRPTNSQKCIAYYEEIRQECADEKEALARAVERVVSEFPMRKENATETEQLSLVEEFKRAKQSIKVIDIFKND